MSFFTAADAIVKYATLVHSTLATAANKPLISSPVLRCETVIQVLLTKDRGKSVEVWCQLGRGFSQSRDET